MLYDCILYLVTGEVVSLPEIKLISWTRARVLFTNVDGETITFRTGEIVDCHLFKIVKKGAIEHEEAAAGV